jgi:protein-serine/threonine kinase
VEPAYTASERRRFCCSVSYNTMEPLKSSAQSSVPSSTPSSGHRLAPSCDQDSLPPADSDAATAHSTHQTSAVSSNATASLLNAQLPPPGTDDDVNASSPLYLPRFHIRNPSAAGLSLQTDLCHEMRPASSDATNKSTAEGNSGDLRHSATAPIPIHDGYLRSALYTASNEALSPASLLSSPALNALTDLTPLPSPLVMSDSPAGPWAHAGMNIRPRSRGASTSSRDDTLVMLSKGSLSPSPSLKKKGYQMLRNAAHQAADATQQKNDAAHGRNRSLSEFKPDALHNIGARHVTISNVAPEQMEVNLIAGTTLHREAYLAAQRGLISAAVNAGIPTPPASNRSVTESEEEDISEDDKIHYITVRQGSQMTKKLWRPVRVLGQGTFSKVWLATDEKRPVKDSLEESTLDPHRLAAIKVVERGPAGGADEERVQLSLKREVEMLRSISHPSLVHLRAFDQGEKQALIVLTYCPGGDLFDVASTHHKLLSLSLVQRIFAEMVSATQYLHNQLIVHRDIKLESTFLRSNSQST